MTTKRTAQEKVVAKRGISKSTVAAGATTAEKRAEEKPVKKKIRRTEPTKAHRPDTLDDEEVPFRPTLDLESQRLLIELGAKWQLRGSPTALRILERYRHSPMDSQPLVAFMRDVLPQYHLEKGAITKRENEVGEVKSDRGKLFLWPKKDYDAVKTLAFDTRWDVRGNMSKMMRVMIYHTALREGFTLQLDKVKPVKK
jgi:hypothetical protein